MFRMYLASAVIAFLSYGTAQYKGWSMFASEAQEFERQKSGSSSSSWGRGSSGSGGSTGGSSGHK